MQQRPDVISSFRLFRAKEDKEAEKYGSNADGEKRQRRPGSAGRRYTDYRFIATIRTLEMAFEGITQRPENTWKAEPGKTELPDEEESYHNAKQNVETIPSMLTYPG